MKNIILNKGKLNMLNKNIQYIIETKASLFDYYRTAICALFMFTPIEFASIIDANLFFKILATLFFGPLILVCLYFLYIQFTYKTQEITQKASVVSYKFKSSIPLKTTGDEK